MERKMLNEKIYDISYIIRMTDRFSLPSPCGQRPALRKKQFTFNPRASVSWTAAGSAAPRRIRTHEKFSHPPPATSVRKRHAAPASRRLKAPNVTARTGASRRAEVRATHHKTFYPACKADTPKGASPACLKPTAGKLNLLPCQAAERIGRAAALPYQFVAGRRCRAQFQSAD
jgi:hypothetical protein